MVDFFVYSKSIFIYLAILETKFLIYLFCINTIIILIAETGVSLKDMKEDKILKIRTNNNFIYTTRKWQAREKRLRLY